MSDAYEHMLEWAGYSYSKHETPQEGRERCARELAAAEHALVADPDLFIVWELDDIDSSFFEDADNPRPLYVALLCIDSDRENAQLVRGYDPRDGIFERPGRIVESQGGIDLADEEPARSAYKRVIEAELYQEFESYRESMIARGEN